MMNKWKQWEIDFLKENYQDMSTEEIAKHIDRSVHGVLGKRYQLGFKQDETVLSKLKTTDKGAIARKRLFREWDRTNKLLPLPKETCLSI